MDLDSIIDDVIKDTNPAAAGPDQQEKNINDLSLDDLLLQDLTPDTTLVIYNRFKYDIENLINDFLIDCKDINAADGMYKCSLETWQACITNIGLYYFRKNKYLFDKKKIAAAGGVALSDDLLSIGLELYEFFCYEYKKQFFIYDCCRFLGVPMELIYKLSNLHGEILKRAHTKQEASMRTALASGRSNVTAMAILLNHDYDYTRTTQIIHSSAAQAIAADKLPELSQDLRNNDKIVDDLLIDDM